MVTQVQLTGSQRAAINYPWRRKISMILSTAGSGKTLVLTHRAIRIAKDLVSDGDFGARILCVCYNRNAAEEMRDRIAALLQAKGLADSVFVSRDSSTMLNMVTIEVRTFHALGFYILKSSYANQRKYVNLDSRHVSSLTGSKLRTKFFQTLQVQGYLSGSDTEKQKRKYISILLKGLTDEKGVLFDKQCGELLRTGNLHHEFRDQKGEFEVYERMLSQENSCDYSDMLRKTVLLLHYSQRTKQRVEKRYRAVLVDEFQDMSASQVYICKSLIEKNESLTLVGDDDQQIYSFRTGLGWVCHDILRTVFSQIDTLTLRENHRCTAAVVKAAYAVINNNINRIVKDIEAVRETGLPVQVIGCKNKHLELEFVIRKVKAILPKARKDGDRVILLFRRNNLLSEFQRRFTQEGIQTTRKATAPLRTRRIGSLALRVYALFSLLRQNTSLKLFIWAAVAVSPCIEDSYLRDVLESQDSTSNMDTIEKPQSSDVKREGSKEEDSHDSHSESPWLRKVKVWYTKHINSSNEEERCTVEMLQTLLAITDSLELKSKATNRLEDLLRHATTLLNCGQGISETGLSSQNAINFEVEGQSASYGSEDPDAEGVDSDGLDALVSSAKKIDENTHLEKTSAGGNVVVSGACIAERNERDSDEEDFEQLFCRDRHVRTTKKRKTTGLNLIFPGHGGVVIGQDVRQQQVEQLCEAAEEKFKVIDKEWLKSEPNGDSIVVLSTVHGAKGCTFPYVFLCGADNDAFPVGGNRALMVDPLFAFWGSCGEMEFHTAHRNNPGYQEERRLFFVALTRTVTEFTCTYSSQGIGALPNSCKSPFIREMLEGLQWDPQYVTESFVNGSEDVLKLLVGREQKGKVQSTNAISVKQEEEEEVQ